MADLGVLESGLMQLMNSKAGVDHVVSYAQGVSMPGAYAFSADELFAKFYQHASSADMQKMGMTPSAAGSHEVIVKTLTGATISCQLGAYSTVADLKAEVQAQAGIQPHTAMFLYAGRQLADGERVFSAVQPGSTIHLMQRLHGAGDSPPIFYVDMSQMAPEWNYDFSDITTDSSTYHRGGRDYKRPLGAERYAIKVLGQYGDGDKWLGSPRHNRTDSSTGEWPVAYHGTKEINVKSIIEQGFLLSKGQRCMHGPGIYCTPDPKTALDYSEAYTHKGKRYRIVLQTRVNPAFMNLVAARDTPFGHSEYWVVQEGGIRPYGICAFDSSHCAFQ